MVALHPIDSAAVGVPNFPPLILDLLDVCSNDPDQPPGHVAGGEAV